MNKNWTKEKIKEGFDKFKKEHGRLPKSVEVDKLTYLPSSRFIQKAFGGLETLRTELGYADSHFGKGHFRSHIAQRVNKRGRNIELYLEKLLRKKFGEIFVHTEKIFDDSKNRVDFYIYSPTGDFGIDVFYPETIKTLQSNVGIKIKKYKNFPTTLFLAVANKSFDQAELDRYSKSKIEPLSENIRIINLKTLLDFLEKTKVYPDPLLK